MNKQRILALIPLTIAAGILIYAWSMFIFTSVTPTWRHCLALLLFLPLPYLLFKNFKIGLFAIGIYFFLGTFDILSLPFLVSRSWYSFRIGSLTLSTPAMQLLPLGLLILYCILNFNSFVTIYVDHKVKDNKDNPE